MTITHLSRTESGSVSVKLCKASQRLLLPTASVINGHYKATLFYTYLLEARYEDTRCNYFTALRREVFLSALTTAEHLHRSTADYLAPGRCFQTTQLLLSDPEESLPPTHSLGWKYYASREGISRFLRAKGVNRQSIAVQIAAFDSKLHSRDSSFSKPKVILETKSV